MQDYLRLIRVKHYIKNLLIFLPLVFGGHLLSGSHFLSVVFAFVAFCAAASIVYIINDVQDRHADAKHPKKRHRPLASGRLSTGAALTTVALLLIVTIVFLYFSKASVVTVGLLCVYIAINLMYSMGLKHVPVVDVAILSLGFLLRVYYGGTAAHIDISNWLYLAVMAFSLYLALGKRRNEIQAHGAATRRVNKFYNRDFLDKNMYVCLTLGIVYYSLWTIDPTYDHQNIFWTVPLVVLIAMTYNLNIESGASDGDPIEVISQNKYLIVLIILYASTIIGAIYFI